MQPADLPCRRDFSCKATRSESHDEWGTAMRMVGHNAQAVAARAAGDLVAKLVPTVRERAKAEFKKKLGDPKR